MSEMISASFVEREAVTELGINRQFGKVLTKMQIDSKTVKIVAEIGGYTVEYVLTKKNPRYTLTGEYDEEDSISCFRHMKGLTNNIFHQNGDGLYDYDDEGNIEIKEEYVTKEIPLHDEDGVVINSSELQQFKQLNEEEINEIIEEQENEIEAEIEDENKDLFEDEEMYEDEEEADSSSAWGSSQW